MAVAVVAWGDEVYKTLDFASATGESSNYTSQWTATAEDGTEYSMENFNRNSTSDQWKYVKCGRKNNASIASIVTSAKIDKAITKVVVTIDAITASKVNSIKLYSSSDNSSWTEAGSYSIAAGAQEVSLSSPISDLYYKIEFDCASGSSNGLVTVSKVEYYYSPSGTLSCATPSFSPVAGTYTESQSVTIDCTTDGAKIYYTIDGTDPTETSSVYSSPITVSETTTIKAIATADGYNNSSVATATYNIVQPLITMDAIFAAATDAGATATPVVITFNNWVVTGVKGNNAYVTDGTKGFIIFGSGHGFKVGNVLSGTATCKVQLYKGAAEITELTSTNTGLIVGDGGTVTPVTNYSIADLSGVNTGAVFSFENLTYDGTNLSDGTNTIKPYTTLFSGTFVNGKSYNVTGVYLQYDDTKEILPRSAEDIEELGDDPIVFNDISDITEVNTGYRVKGTVVATNARGLVIGDGTGYVYYYKNAAVSQSVGDLVSIYGNSATYGHILQFTNTATVAEVTESNYNYTPAATVITEVPDYSEGYYLSTYLQFEGKLSKDNNSYFITLGESQIQISYPTSDQGNALTALNGKTALVKGYFTGINSNNIFTIMLESVEEMAGTDPVINAENVTLAYDATSGEITYTLDNATGNVTAAITTGDWLTLGEVGANSIPFTCSANEGTEDRTATITLSYEGAEDVMVTVTQKHFVAGVASLPFEFDGGTAAIAETAGLTQKDLGDYTSSPKLKFDGTGDYLILHFDGTPGTLSFDIKGNSFSGGTFTVQTSVDGETYTDLATYTELGTTQSEKFSNLGADIRYIKWIYTEKSSGNVALGNIVLKEPSNDPIINAEDLTIEADATSGEISYTITNSVEGTSLTASTETEWITNVSVGMEKVTFTTTANDGAERTGTITLSYGSVSKKDVTITQKRAVVSGEVKYELVTSTENLTDGQYLIVSSLDEYAVAFDGSLETLDAVSNNKFVEVSDKVIMASDDISFTISVVDGTIKSASGYYIGVSTNSNGLKQTGDAETYKNAFDVDEEGNAAITAVFDGSNMSLRYNGTSGQDRFRYYKNNTEGQPTQGAIQLYKKVTVTKKGDVNKDGDVTIADVTALVNILLNKDTTAYDLKAANVDGANGITVADVEALVNIILGKN